MCEFITQQFDFTNYFLIERRTGMSGRLKKIICRIKGQVRLMNYPG